MASYVDNFSDLQELGINVSESYDALSVSFAKAADHLQKLLPNVDNQTLLTLYGYYKQGTEGTCNAPKPSWYDVRSKAKWEAWNKLGKMPRNEAKTMYIDTLKKLDPTFETILENGAPTEQWVKVSSMMAESISSSDMRIADFIKSGDVMEVQKYLRGGVKSANLNVLDQEGLGVVHWAADSGNLEILKLLVDAGAGLELRDGDGQTALHYAASCGHVHCVKFLMDKGADVGVLDNDGNSPADVTNDDDIKELLMR
ncbi:hypothetical protein JTB14_035572 [Gonioctena quinquepunctata]|nr:hypothetical protein JTB14_035572 [Gonioctena quinquepunctata]